MKKILRLTLIISALTFSLNMKAQPPDPGGGGGNDQPGCFPPPCIPIDGGLAWLLVAGAAYGGKKAFDLKNREEQH